MQCQYSDQRWLHSFTILTRRDCVCIHSFTILTRRGCVCIHSITVLTRRDCVCINSFTLLTWRGCVCIHSITILIRRGCVFKHRDSQTNNKRHYLVWQTDEILCFTSNIYAQCSNEECLLLKWYLISSSSTSHIKSCFEATYNKSTNHTPRKQSQLAKIWPPTSCFKKTI